jgi:hypothetical protein
MTINFLLLQPRLQSRHEVAKLVASVHVMPQRLYNHNKKNCDNHVFALFDGDVLADMLTGELSLG